jgi:uncharacterized NAD(P)/FAD-binding protein YdhS
MSGVSAVTGSSTVVIVGGGAAGVLAAAQLARAAQAVGRAVDLCIVEPGRLGVGVAYSTRDLRHRLNVRVAGMSAWPDDPDHFLRWLRHSGLTDATREDFAPRPYYAEYLRAVLREALAGAPGVSLTHVPGWATGVVRRERRMQVVVDSGPGVTADALVLATGHGAPSTAWAPAELCRSPHFVADPWRGQLVPASAAAGSAVVLVGAGLTMADMALQYGRPGVHLHVVSRHGLMPLPHLDTGPAPRVRCDGAPSPASLAQARRYVFDHIRATGDWRAAVDALRPVTSDIWRSLDDRARRDFLRADARRWDRVRHRLAPAVSTWLSERAADGCLTVHRATIETVTDSAGGARVTLSDGTDLMAAAVVNCTGTCVDVRASENPLLTNLFHSGIAQPGPLQLGLATDGGGRLRTADATSSRTWTLGPPRRGELWESTAIPEIRVQARELAVAMVRELDVPRLAHRDRGSYDWRVIAAEPAPA